MTKKKCIACKKINDKIPKRHIRIISQHSRLNYFLVMKQTVAEFFNINTSDICECSIICNKHIIKLMRNKEFSIQYNQINNPGNLLTLLCII